MNRRSYETRQCCEGPVNTVGALANSVVPELPDPTLIDATTTIFSTLSDGTRLRILLALSHGEMCVCDIASAVGASQSAVSHQLRLLRDRHLVTFERNGKHALYRLADTHVANLLAQGLEHAGERR